MKKTLFTGLLLMAMLASFGYVDAQGDGPASGGGRYEVMTVLEYLPKLKIFEPGKEMQEVLMKGGEEGYAKTLEETFSKFYDKGWRLITTSEGGSNTKRYFFEREKQ